MLSLTTLFGTLSSIFRSRAALELENLALRHQIGILQHFPRPPIRRAALAAHIFINPLHGVVARDESVRRAALILEEMERFGVKTIFLECGAADDPALEAYAPNHRSGS